MGPEFFSLGRSSRTGCHGTTRAARLDDVAQSDVQVPQAHEMVQRYFNTETPSTASHDNLKVINNGAALSGIPVERNALVVRDGRKALPIGLPRHAPHLCRPGMAMPSSNRSQASAGTHGNATKCLA